MKQSIWFLVVRWPATTCALVLLAMYALLAPLNLEYDDNGLGSLLFLVNSVLGFFFLAAGDALYSLNGNQWLRYHTLCTVLVGFPFYVLCDLLLHFLSRLIKKPFGR
ncbi:MAG: hypothetical protein AB1898_32255 [Acidobacteriota bacterium]